MTLPEQNVRAVGLDDEPRGAEAVAAPTIGTMLVVLGLRPPGHQSQLADVWPASVAAGLPAEGLWLVLVTPPEATVGASLASCSKFKTNLTGPTRN